MSVLLLRWLGRSKAWGVSSRFNRRDTRPEPTKSSVCRLLAAAEGRWRSDPIEDPARLLGVRIDQPGSILRDDQTVSRLEGSLPTADGKYRKEPTLVTERLSVQMASSWLSSNATAA